MARRGSLYLQLNKSYGALIDGEVIKELIFEDKKGKLLKTNSKITQIKGS